MRVVPQTMTDRWKSQLKVGDSARPTVRATIQVANLRKFEYDTFMMPGGTYEPDKHRRGVYSSIVFGNNRMVREIRNIKSCQWTRSTDQDAATCTLTLLNSDITPIGNQEEVAHEGDFDLPGFFTYNRGQQRISANRWGYDTDTGWQNVFVPDRIVKTYEGYGVAHEKNPSEDPNLLLSGTWLIDKVTYGADGEITLEMRDFARLLFDQIVFPPVVPYDDYPLEWSRIRTANVPGRQPTGGEWHQIRKSEGTTSSSNDFYIGKGLTNPPFKHYVGPNGGFNGHHANHALVNAERNQSGDIDPEYWMSTGQTTGDSKVWWQVDFDNPISLAGVRIHPQMGPFRVYVSIKTDKGWIGRKKVPYRVTTEGIDVRAGIPFVRSMLADRGYQFDLVFLRKYKNVKAIRLTFGRLTETRTGKYPFRAGLRDIWVYTAPTYEALGFKDGKRQKVVGNYRDYTDIVKWVCAWGGWFWPPHSTDADFIQTDIGEASRKYVTWDVADWDLAKGRVWGDFMKSNTQGEEDLSKGMFDKKPLMDVINYVRDMLGFLFFIDETGAVVWRMPNIWKAGNYLSPGEFGQRTRARTLDYVTIDEKDTLISYATTLSSENVRERIFVANSTGKVGTVIKGYNPFPTGMRRIAGWSDQNFETKRETVVMADMIAARQMFDYRRAKVTIPGYPAIQIDDQIRIFERVTNETYYHYVLGITSSLDMEAGTWDYELDTHWLGERPSDAWVVRVDELEAVTQAYLNTLE